MSDSNKNIYTRARLDADLKQKAEKILKNIGVTPTMAIRTLYMLIIEQNGWPKGMDLHAITPNSRKRKKNER